MERRRFLQLAAMAAEAPEAAEMTVPEDAGLAQTFARAADGAFAVGPDGHIALWNRAAEKLLGYSAREALGRACCDVFAASDDAGNRLCYRGCHVMSLVTMGEAVQSFDMRTRTKSGRPIWLDVSTLAAGPRRRGRPDRAPVP